MAFEEEVRSFCPRLADTMTTRSREVTALGVVNEAHVADLWWQGEQIHGDVVAWRGTAWGR